MIVSQTQLWIGLRRISVCIFFNRLQRFIEFIKIHNLGSDIDVHFVFGGTAGDVLAISGLFVRSSEKRVRITKKNAVKSFARSAVLPSSIYAIVCANTAHLNTSQCGAAEKFTGSKVIAVQSDAYTAKLTPASIDAALYGFGDQHSSQPLVLTVSQTTEFGTVYSLDELRELRAYCDSKKMLLHIGQCTQCILWGKDF